MSQGGNCPSGNWCGVKCSDGLRMDGRRATTSQIFPVSERSGEQTCSATLADGAALHDGIYSHRLDEDEGGLSLRASGYGRPHTMAGRIQRNTVKGSDAPAVHFPFLHSHSCRSQTSQSLWRTAQTPASRPGAVLWDALLAQSA